MAVVVRIAQAIIETIVAAISLAIAYLAPRASSSAAH
jgi:hypothetical protein